MAGNLTLDQLQIGNNADPTRNFVLRTNADGTMTIARGNVGATTQDLIVVDSLGNVTQPVISFDGVTSDKTIGVGATVSYDVTGVTSIPLYIATSNKQVYEIYMGGAYTATAAAASTVLRPNNTAYANQFTIRQVFESNNTAGGTGAANVDTGFRFDAGGSSVYACRALVFTNTAAKRCIAQSSSTTATISYASHIGSEWQDTTTPWTSLGTIVLPNAWTGQVIVKRVA